MSPLHPPTIFSTSQWGAKPPAALFPEGTAEGIVIHNTEHPNRPPLQEQAERDKAFDLARSIQHDHMIDNGWSDTGQHFTISRGGVIMEGRHGSLEGAHHGMVVRGAHAGINAGQQNRHWFGIELEGNNNDEFVVTETQWDACTALCAWLSFWGNFDSLHIEGHRHFSPTSCPGHVMEHLPDLRNAVHNLKVSIKNSLS